MADVDSIFERNPKTTLALVWLAFLVLFAAGAELLLRHFSGLGNPVLFQAHPAYGYRLKPNQETWRFHGAHFKINNLGLRAHRDWDAVREGKILFLGDSVTYGGNHVSNHELFSEVARAWLAGYESGNAGVPDWGVENVYGLVVEGRFRPAGVYVSTFIEDDFYRGPPRGRKLPWVRYEPPLFALQELAEFLWHKFVKKTRQWNKRKREGEPAEMRVARAALKLQALDALLRDRGDRHFIFISPTREQVLGHRPRDARVQAELDKHGIEAVYLLDAPIMRTAPPDVRRAWYQDNFHLTPKGHAVWGELIGERLAQTLQARTVPTAARNAVAASAISARDWRRELPQQF
jgi:hypothetical protein